MPATVAAPRYEHADGSSVLLASPLSCEPYLLSLSLYNAKKKNLRPGRCTPEYIMPALLVKPLRGILVGPWSATTRSSRTSSGWITSKAGVGVGSTTMARYASRRTPSWRPSGLGFPPLSLCPSSTPLAYPVVSSRGALPVRPERHVPGSLTTMLTLRSRALLRQIPCTWCGHTTRAR